ncbi:MULTISPECIES: LuxR C-terminal-related transcriptional regulator [Heyndrickxia]|uniref:LuxR C-terminal-related transcriptional regulator n=1 Tax=Heyndrickxia TaxID=2837504 RepID=UPI002DBD60CE|nr:LuxR C-terminal-related transcriptional regulator [Weizmannia sp. CD-2023]MEC2222864.1 helix-turn-helix domain-containing protein [Weizmannia sp. CD-2023]
MNKKEIEQILKDYHWMINSIKIMRKSLQEAGEERLTAQYGDESALPKPKGTTSDPVYRELLRREKRWRKIEQYERKVKMIQDRIHVIQDEREFEVLHWLLDGKSYSWIARHMGLSERHIRRLKDSIVEQMSEMPSLPKTS